MQGHELRILKDVTQAPAQTMRPVSPAKVAEMRDKQAARYRAERLVETPLLPIVRGLRSRILETSGLHHNFWGAEDWAERVRAKQAAHDEAVKEKNATALADLAKVQQHMEAHGIDTASLAQRV